MKADWVSLKFDSICKAGWRKINRPHKELELDEILNGMPAFSKIYSGELVTETMLVHGIGVDGDTLKAMADFLSRLYPAKVYLAIPTRPPAETWVRPSLPGDINAAFQLFQRKID